jgi:hypothetical protein
LEGARRRNTAHALAGGLVALASALVVVSCSGAHGSDGVHAQSETTPEVTTVALSTFDRDACVEHLKPTIAALRPQPPHSTDPNVTRHDHEIDAAQLDFAKASARLNVALNASLLEGCTNAPTAERVTRCLSGLPEAIASTTDRAALALSYASFALQVPNQTTRDQTLVLDAAVLRVTAGIESWLRDQVLACTPMQTREP